MSASPNLPKDEYQSWHPVAPLLSMNLSYRQPLSGPNPCIVAQNRKAEKAYCHKNNQNKSSLNIIQPVFVMQKSAKTLSCLLEQSFLSQWLSCGVLYWPQLSRSECMWGLQKGIWPAGHRVPLHLSGDFSFLFLSFFYYEKLGTLQNQRKQCSQVCELITQPHLLSTFSPLFCGLF